MSSSWDQFLRGENSLLLLTSGAKLCQTKSEKIYVVFELGGQKNKREIKSPDHGRRCGNLYCPRRIFVIGQNDTVPSCLSIRYQLYEQGWPKKCPRLRDPASVRRGEFTQPRTHFFLAISVVEIVSCLLRPRACRKERNIRGVSQLFFAESYHKIVSMAHMSMTLKLFDNTCDKVCSFTYDILVNLLQFLNMF